MNHHCEFLTILKPAFLYPNPSLQIHGACYVGAKHLPPRRRTQTRHDACNASFQPIITVGHPIIMLPPWAVLSPILAAGRPPIITVALPAAMLSGGPAQVHMPPTVAAGIPPTITVGAPGGITGPPMCGLPPGSIMGQMCMSPTLAADGIIIFLFSPSFPLCLIRPSGTFSKRSGALDAIALERDMLYPAGM